MKRRLTEMDLQLRKFEYEVCKYAYMLNGFDESKIDEFWKLDESIGDDLNTMSSMKLAEMHNDLSGLVKHIDKILNKYRSSENSVYNVINLVAHHHSYTKYLNTALRGVKELHDEVKKSEINKSLSDMRF